MRLIDADSVLKGIDELRKSPWYNVGKEIESGHFHVGFLARREAIGVIVDLCIKSAPTIQPDAPRVLTLEEVIQHYSLPPCFVDDLGAQEDYYEDIQPLYFEFPYQKEDSWIVHWRGHAQVARYLDEWKHTYNQKWRCWTAKPTDEQKKAVKWDE